MDSNINFNIDLIGWSGSSHGTGGNISATPGDVIEVTNCVDSSILWLIAFSLFFNIVLVFLNFFLIRKLKK